MLYFEGKNGGEMDAENFMICWLNQLHEKEFVFIFEFISIVISWVAFAISITVLLIIFTIQTRQIWGIW